MSLEKPQRAKKLEYESNLISQFKAHVSAEKQ